MESIESTYHTVVVIFLYAHQVIKPIDSIGTTTLEVQTRKKRASMEAQVETDVTVHVYRYWLRSYIGNRLFGGSG